MLFRIVALTLLVAVASGCSNETSPSPQPGQRVALTGTVYAAASSRTIQDVRVQILGGTNAGRETLTNGAGRYDFADLIPGTLTLQFSSSGYADLRTTEVVTTDKTLEVRLERGPEPGFILSGIVSTQWGEPIDDVGVEAVHDGRVFGGGTTNRSGAYSIPTLPAQDYIVRAIKFGYKTPQLPVAFTANTTLNIVLDRVRVEITGSVEEMSPCTGTIDGARVEIVSGPDAGVATTTGATGYRLENINWGTFRLRASKSGYAPVEVAMDVIAPGSGNPPGPLNVRQNFRLQRTTGC